VGLGVPQSAIELEICGEAPNFLTRVKEFLGVEAPEDLRGAIMTINDADPSHSPMIDDTLARYSARKTSPRAITGETDIPTVRSSTGVPIKPISERESTSG
jgi:hypothetical protein